MGQIVTFGDLIDSINRRSMDSHDRSGALRDISLMAEKARKILAMNPKLRQVSSTDSGVEDAS